MKGIVMTWTLLCILSALSLISLTGGQSSPGYVQIFTGTCESNGYETITSSTECRTAADELELTVTFETSTSSASRPYGCYYSSSSLYTNEDEAAIGNGADGSRTPLCRLPPSPPPPPPPQDTSINVYGRNNRYQLGDGSTENGQNVEMLTDLHVLMIVAGSDHSIAITLNKDVYGWGRGTEGQLGTGTFSDITTPTRVFAAFSVEQVVTSPFWHVTFFSTDTGSWYATGESLLYDSSSGYSDVPYPSEVFADYAIQSLECGQKTVFFITTDGNVYAQGVNDYGVLGLGYASAVVETPVQTLTNCVGCTVTSVVAGGYHTLFITSEGVYATGRSDMGQLGDGVSSTAVVENYNFILPTLTMDGYGIVEVAAGLEHTVFRTESGNVYTCGSNTYGQLGTGDLSYRTTPTQILGGRLIGQVAASKHASFFFDLDGERWMATGRNNYAQLNVGSSTSSISTPAYIGGEDSSYFQLAAGNEHTVSLHGWRHAPPVEIVFSPPPSPPPPRVIEYVTMGAGGNGHGELGTGSTSSVSPAEVVLSDLAVSKVLAAGTHSVVLVSGGLLFTVGDNQYGQLCVGSTTTGLSPVQVASSVQDAFIGRYNTFYTSGDSFYACGRNDNGQLGDGTSASVTSAVTTMDSYTVTQASAGTTHCIFLTSGGQAFTAGYNYRGVLGQSTDASHVTTPSLADIPSGERVVLVSTLNYHSIFVTSNGRAYIAGENSEGQLGQPLTLEYSSSPLRVLNDSYHVTKAVAGGYHTVLLAEGRGGPMVFTFGYNNKGQLGLESSLVNIWEPTVVTALHSNVTGIAAGFSSTFIETEGSAELQLRSSSYCNLVDAAGTRMCDELDVTVHVPYGTGDTYSVELIESCSSEDYKCTVLDTDCGHYQVARVVDNNGNFVHIGSSDGMLSCGDQQWTFLSQTGGTWFASGDNSVGQLNIADAATSVSVPKPVMSSENTIVDIAAGHESTFFLEDIPDPPPPPSPSPPPPTPSPPPPCSPPPPSPPPPLPPPVFYEDITISNTGFETGTTQAWTTSGSVTIVDSTSDTSWDGLAAGEGTFFAALPVDNFIEQKILGLVSGMNYTVRFQAAAQPGHSEESMLSVEVMRMKMRQEVLLTRFYTYQFNFTATATEAMLTFRNSLERTIAVDGVSVEEQTQEVHSPAPGSSAVNVALAGVATQSSQYGTYVAGYGNDGDTGGRLQHTVGSKGETNPWWQVHLTTSYQIDDVVLYNRDNHCASRLFYGWACNEQHPAGSFDAAYQGAIIGVSSEPCSGDSCSGTVCGKITQSSSSHQYTVSCRGASGSYVYIQLLGHNRMLHVYELQAWSSRDPVDSQNVALLGTASMSSLYNSAYASYAIDGNTGGTLAHTQGRYGETSPWLHVQLPSETSIDKVVVYNRAGNCAARLFLGWSCSGEFPTGTYTGNNQGAIIGVSSEPCSGDSCSGTECGKITQSSSSHQYTVSCNGATGSYVYIILPGEERMLNIYELEAWTVPEVSTMHQIPAKQMEYLSGTEPFMGVGQISNLVDGAAEEPSEHLMYTNARPAEVTSVSECDSWSFVASGGDDVVKHCSSLCMQNADCEGFWVHTRDFIYPGKCCLYSAWSTASDFMELEESPGFFYSKKPTRSVCDIKEGHTVEGFISTSSTSNVFDDLHCSSICNAQPDCTAWRRHTSSFVCDITTRGVISAPTFVGSSYYNAGFKCANMDFRNQNLLVLSSNQAPVNTTHSGEGCDAGFMSQTVFVDPVEYCHSVCLQDAACRAFYSYSSSSESGSGLCCIMSDYSFSDGVTPASSRDVTQFVIKAATSTATLARESNAEVVISVGSPRPIGRVEVCVPGSLASAATAATYSSYSAYGPWTPLHTFSGGLNMKGCTVSDESPNSPIVYFIKYVFATNQGDSTATMVSELKVFSDVRDTIYDRAYRSFSNGGTYGGYRFCTDCIDDVEITTEAACIEYCHNDPSCQFAQFFSGQVEDQGCILLSECGAVAANNSDYIEFSAERSMCKASSITTFDLLQGAK